MRSWKLGTAFGIGIYVHWTFLLLAAYVLIQNYKLAGPDLALYSLVLLFAVFGWFGFRIARTARDPFGHASRVDKHERRVVLGNELSEARVDLPPHFLRHHRLERRSRNLEAQIAAALMPSSRLRRCASASSCRR